MANRPPDAPSNALRAGWMPTQLTVRCGRLGAYLDLQSPWRLRGLAFLFGALAAAGLPPIHALPVLLVSFSGLLLLLDRAPRPIAAIVLGWCFGFGYFVVGIYWVANALLAAASAFGWMLPFAIAGAVGGLSAVLACFPALAAGLARALWPAGPARILVLAVCWTVFEWARGWVFTGFPWNLLGYSWAFSDAMNQFAALAGIWGLSLVTVIVAASPALLVDWTDRKVPVEAAPQRVRAAVGCIVGGFMIVLAIYAGGWLRLSGAGDGTVPDVRLRLVQADIEPGEKGAADRAADNLGRHLRLSVEPPSNDKVTHIVWAETATPYPLERVPEARTAIADAVPENGLLITGVLRTDPPDGRIKEIWNSLAAVDRAGQIVGTYDKFHLVPFGEYVPLHRLLPFISRFTPGIMDFSAGPGARTLRLPGLPPVGPLICYEIIFPGQVVDRKDRPEWLLNLTNDGWYGISTGPHQHFASARLRAVEEGLPVVRAANTGISGVIDAYGRIRAQTRLGEAAFLDAELPQGLERLTPYARWGDATAAVLLAIVAAVAFGTRTRM